MRVNIYIDSGTHIELKDYRIVIDPTKKYDDVDLAIISHAHSDHYTSSIFKTDYPKLMSFETLEILNSRIRKESNKIKNFQLIKENETLKFGKNKEVKITAYNSGHCVGGLEFLIEINDRKIVYTGDFCLESRLGFKRGKLIRGTDLIIDSTYFDEQFQFPPRNQIYSDILKWIKSRLIDQNQEQLIIFGRRLGTCQELTRLLNFSTLKKDYNLSIYTHPLVYWINQVHSDYYENLGDYEYLKNPLKNKTEYGTKVNKDGKSVYIAPFFLSTRKKIEKLFPDYNIANFGLVTGWTISNRFYIKGFPLTSHADYNQIMYYKSKSGAKNVYFV
ncbi:MAG: MBL fold metallo-hydrolase [Candidatus Helarchaeota archaeon]